MDHGPTVIRPARAEDAEALARLANALDRDQGGQGTNFSKDQVLADGFGRAPRFEALVAEADGGLVGYAIFNVIYNTDLAAPGLWMGDLFVDGAHQGRGVGRKLMAAVARAAVERGAVSVWWGAYLWNTRAKAFYDRLGATGDEARVFELQGPALTRLAGEAEG